MDISQRAAVHAALGDETRLRLVDALWLNDRSPLDLHGLLGIDTNLLAHHLGVLDAAGVIQRRASGGDGRRRYVTARWEVLEGLLPPRRLDVTSVLFICSHNSARSQFAEALLSSRAQVSAQSAGFGPSGQVHPKAVKVAGERGLDLSGAHPKPYSEVTGSPDLVVSVCDRACEAPIPFEGPRMHWSVPDPVETNRIDGFREAFDEVARRVDRLIDAIPMEVT